MEARMLASLAIASSLALFAPVQEETKEQHDARMKWWREARFGMFVHFGLYSSQEGEWKGHATNGAGEWLQFNEHIPPAEYEPLLPQFDPEKFDAKQWVSIAKDAGMKYLVITTKHHEGFALFDTKTTPWSVKSTPFHRDVMKELSDECAKQGVVMGWYHSILDWHHPDYLPRGPGSPRPWDTRPTDGASYDRYLEFMKAQLTELCTNYGRIGVLWFDGGWEHDAKGHHADEVVALLRKLQPQIVINDRLNIPQDFSTPEQFIPATGLPGRDWETCMTMNETWGFKRSDTNWKSTETLIRNLVDIASKGGNFLLNVGPTREGLIPAASVERLAAMGKWMKVNGESIYATTASPFRRLAFGRCTTRVSPKPGVDAPNTLYLHLFDWPKDGKLRVPGLRNEPRAARLLADRSRAGVAAKREGDDVVVSLPGTAPDPIDSVVALEFAGALDVVAPVLRPADDGKLVLDAIDADVHGSHAAYESDPPKQCIGFWTDEKDFVSWDLELPKPGRYTLTLCHACDDGTAGAEAFVAVGKPEQPGPERSFKVAATGGWTKFVTTDLGTVDLPAGRQTLVVKTRTKPAFAVMNLRSVTLTPAK
jgi:alpha-L-fucosidase